MPPVLATVQANDGSYVKSEAVVITDPLDSPSTKLEVGFRNYDQLEETSSVSQFYKINHEMQTYDHVMEMKKKYYGFDHGKYTIMELFEVSDQIVDESDPDLHLSQLQHAIQTAERARQLHPDPSMDWFWLTAFLHDLGKILAVWGEPQWTVVGDTFPVGCAFDKTAIYHHYFAANPDTNNDKYNTPNGIYEANCGFDKVAFSFGHDDYLSSCLEYNGTSLPYEAIYCVRYHSFYPWHQASGYEHLANEKDHSLRRLLCDFQSCDLYSKDDGNIYTDEKYNKLETFYKNLCDKYIGLTKILAV